MGETAMDALNTMNALVIYDSFFSTTKIVAIAIGNVIGMGT